MAKILVVDDDEALCKMIAEMLEVDQHEVRTAPNGTLGEEAYRAEPADLIITDLVMPGKTGIDLIMELRKEFPGIKILAMSGGGGITGHVDYLPVAHLVGAKEILHKPFGMKELREAVMHSLEQSK